MTKLPVRDIDREGIHQEVGTAGFWDTLGDFFSGISIQFGATQPPPPPVPETKEVDKTLIYVVIGFGALIVLLLLFRK